MTHDDIVDVTIIGGGPAGLAAAYYAGHRNLSVRLLESLEQLGGQPSAVYPEKHIFDVAGFPKINAQGFVDRMVEQGLQFGAAVELGVDIQTLEREPVPDEPLGEVLVVGTADGRRFRSRTLIISAGHGAFEPRTLDVVGLESWRGRGLHYFVNPKSAFADRRCVIIGGGDSALDWTINLQDTAAGPIHLVHRRDAFRGLESTLDHVRQLESEGAATIHTPYELVGVEGDGHLEAIVLEHAKTKEVRRIECDALILQLGFISRLGPMGEWGFEVHGKKQVAVTPNTMETNLPNVFAIGDFAWYDGKITLITIGLGEAAIAANNCVARIRGEKLQPKYSTE
jgi:thioredoxin reductase (NADPH)